MRVCIFACPVAFVYTNKYTIARFGIRSKLMKIKFHSEISTKTTLSVISLDIALYEYKVHYYEYKVRYYEYNIIFSKYSKYT